MSDDLKWRLARRVVAFSSFRFWAVNERVLGHKIVFFVNRFTRFGSHGSHFFLCEPVHGFRFRFDSRLSCFLRHAARYLVLVRDTTTTAPSPHHHRTTAPHHHPKKAVNNCFSAGGPAGRDAHVFYVRSTHNVRGEHFCRAGRSYVIYSFSAGGPAGREHT